MDMDRTARARTARRWRFAATAAAAALLIAGAVLVATTGDEEPRAQAPVVPAPSPTTTMEPPPPTRPGDESTEAPLLPDGPPSTPHAGELVASVAQIHNGGFHLFADGRLIGILDDRGPQWLEQRLTPEGVERVRSEILASGLFDPARLPREVSFCEILQMCVRDGGRLLAQDEFRSGPPWPPAPEAARLLDYYRNLGSSLPPTAWADQEVKPFVPSRVGVCLRMFVDKVKMPVDLSVLLPRFPVPAAALLGARVVNDDIADNVAAGATCVEMSLEEARTLADELLAPSGGGTHAYWGIVFKFDQGRLGAYVGFHELLPDGAPLLWGG